MESINHTAQYHDQQINMRTSRSGHASPFARCGKEPAQVWRGGRPMPIFIRGGWRRSFDKTGFRLIRPAFIQVGRNAAVTTDMLATAAWAEIASHQLLAAALQYRNAEQYDIDPDRITLADHLGGAHARRAPSGDLRRIRVSGRPSAPGMDGAVRSDGAWTTSGISVL